MKNNSNGATLPNTRSNSSPIESLEGLAEFVAVVEAESITAAARTLGIPRETLGRRLSRLEERLAVRLLHRTTRRIAPSQAGVALYERARRIVADGQAAAEAVRRLDGVPRGRLRITVPPSDASGEFAEMLRTFAVTYPAVEIELLATARHVDLVAEGFDVALRAGTVHDPSLVTRSLMHSLLQVVATPNYLEARGTPKRPEDLASHECIRGFDTESRPVRSWPLRAGGTVPVHGRMAANELSVIAGFAFGGFGLALLPEIVTRSALAKGALVPVLPEVGARSQVAIVFPERELLDPKVRAFVEHVVAFFEARGTSAREPLIEHEQCPQLVPSDMRAPRLLTKLVDG